MDPSRFFKDKKGKLVIVQMPNKPLIVAAAFYFLRFIPLKPFEVISSWATPAAFLYWSALEITSGESPFRRVLGIVVFVYSAISLVKMLIS